MTRIIKSMLVFSEEVDPPDTSKTCRNVIYRIVNKENGRVYIGKTERSFRYRYGAKWWEAKHNRALRADLNIYGKDAFAVDILVHDLDPKELTKVEEFLIFSHNSLHPNGYNLMKASFGPDRISEETRAIMSKAQSGRKHSEETKKKIGAANKGTIRTDLRGAPKSESHRAKIAAAKKGKKWSKESRDKITGECNARSKAVTQLNPQTGGEIKRFSSIAEASREIKIDDTGIVRACKGKSKTAAGYGWKYTI